MNLSERFEVLEDPRDMRGKKYKLIDIMITTIYGIVKIFAQSQPTPPQRQRGMCYAQLRKNYLVRTPQRGGESNPLRLNKEEDFSNIAYFSELNSEYYVEMLKIECGKTPSHDCLSDVYAAINPQKFMEIFIEWTKDIVEIKSGCVINIDGKAVREGQDRIKGGNIP